ncbi:2OG-Fe(II) oxygenase [Flavobacterium sp. D11R37]|uniref:2OG-Fe(II) oxygenase n=1 Tax=Flavobacterium coralii TaxID=2838017 RepID=UPI001CA6B919|nr:2OG-Fe(II) oxygenase [Flavobacterium coralii]MBY8963895.1 2OG-Fe(II) oxygenase [Flavobacterium coralii]
MKRQDYSAIIYQNILDNKQTLKQQYESSKSGIGYFYLDNLLPEELALEIYNAFPEAKDMVWKKSIREDKYVAAQMNLYNPLLEEIIYAFQDAKIVDLVAEICGLKGAIPDENLYAGGISMMGHKQFLNPHLDNSHDKDRKLWRILNLLYYVTPEWEESYGGNLELWPDGLKNPQITIHSKFNRLAVMATHNRSLHSVSPVTHNGYRCCVSNYYFSQSPVHDDDTFHVTSFRGRPENKLTDKILQADAWLRMGIRKIFKKGIVENPHVYKKDKND